MIKPAYLSVKSASKHAYMGADIANFNVVHSIILTTKHWYLNTIDSVDKFT